MSMIFILDDLCVYADVRETLWAQDNMASSMMAPAVFAMLLLAVAVFQLVGKSLTTHCNYFIGTTLQSYMLLISYCWCCI